MRNDKFENVALNFEKIIFSERDTRDFIRVFFIKRKSKSFKVMNFPKPYKHISRCI